MCLLTQQWVVFSSLLTVIVYVSAQREHQVVVNNVEGFGWKTAENRQVRAVTKYIVGYACNNRTLTLDDKELYIETAFGDILPGRWTAWVDRDSTEADQMAEETWISASCDDLDYLIFRRSYASEEPKNPAAGSSTKEVSFTVEAFKQSTEVRDVVEHQQYYRAISLTVGVACNNASLSTDGEKASAVKELLDELVPAASWNVEVKGRSNVIVIDNEESKKSPIYYALCYCGGQEYHIGRGTDDNGALHRPLGSTTDTPAEIEIANVSYRMVEASTADIVTQVLKFIIGDACNRKDPKVDIIASVESSFKKLCGHELTGRWSFISGRDIQGFQPAPTDYNPHFSLYAHCRGLTYFFWTTEPWRENRDFCGVRVPVVKRCEVELDLEIRVKKSAEFIILDGHASRAREPLLDIIEHSCLNNEPIQDVVERMCPGRPSVWQFSVASTPFIEKYACDIDLRGKIGPQMHVLACRKSWEKGTDFCGNKIGQLKKAESIFMPTETSNRDRPTSDAKPAKVNEEDDEDEEEDDEQDLYDFDW
ncbi:hypothetical protein BV898_15336 [Hypsibius exemplaris]|uniref:Uncharacterized protein n=1 Tax=Hypsibius exemplaris TaxID=2072580 RepID=A0A9X6NHM7_HYPEX|nr:hypothetical protein BV898_15336 [Hypsibius exemplaris]